MSGTGTTSYALDELGRLTSVTTPGPTVVGYCCDLDGLGVLCVSKLTPCGAKSS